MFSLFQAKNQHVATTNDFNFIKRKKLANTLANFLNDKLSGETDNYNNF